MADSLVLVRHARPHVASSQAPGSWVLTEDGRDLAQLLGQRLSLVRRSEFNVVASTELKAVATAEALGLGRVVTDERLREVSRPWLEDEATFRAGVHGYLNGEHSAGWEPLHVAAARFDAAVRVLPDEAVVVTHGTVMSAWLLDRLHDFDGVWFWEELEMPDAWHVDLIARVTERIAASSCG